MMEEREKKQILELRCLLKLLQVLYKTDSVNWSIGISMIMREIERCNANSSTSRVPPGIAS